MKKNYIYLIILFFGFLTNAQVVNFQDPNFKAKLLSASPDNTIAYSSLTNSYAAVDSNADGEIEFSETVNIVSLFIPDSNITDLTGISAFANLIGLYCYNNSIADLDLSGLYNLTYLNCSNNQLAGLNLPDSHELYTLNCMDNNLTTLNLFAANNLNQLYCSYNDLTNIVMSNAASLTKFYCRDNSLSGFSFNFQNLTELDCTNNQITALNVSFLADLDTLKCGSNQLQSLNLGGLSNLKQLYCDHNQMQSLEVNGLSNLINIQCGYNQLTTVTLDNFPFLQYFNCENNQLSQLTINNAENLTSVNCAANMLSSVSFNNLPGLTDLTCNANQLTSLNVSGFPNLVTLGAFYNQLTSIDLSNNTNLTSLILFHNPLNALSVTNSPNLTTLGIGETGITGINTDNQLGLSYLECLNCEALSAVNFQNNKWLNQITLTNTLLTSLDLSSQLSNTNQVYVANNAVLNAVYAKNGVSENNFDFANCPNLQYICADENEITAIQETINSLGANTVVNSYCSFVPGGPFFTIQGNDRFDTENDGCDIFDTAAGNLKFAVTNGSTNGIHIADNSGAYSIPVQAGSYTVTPLLEMAQYFTIAPSALSIDFPAATSPNTNDFCITANGVHPDIEVVIIPLTAAVPGFDALYKIIYRNKGNLVQSGSVSFQYDDSGSDYVTSNPVFSAQSTDNLFWDFTDLRPFETREISLSLNLNAPTDNPPVMAGQLLYYTANITSPETDETQDDNNFTLYQTTVNSLDPNDKTCLEGENIAPELAGKYVHYVIRFENNGTANAQNIVVKDVIDTTKFNIASLTPLNGSHPFSTRITGNNKVEFIFENIQLPFNEDTNDGFVAFKIKTLSTLVAGTSFSNTAGIYFDYNAPVITNTATTTLQVLGTDDFEFGSYFTLYPNPAKDILNIKMKQDIQLKSVSIFNTLGQLLVTVANPYEAIDVAMLKTGNYFITVNTNKGTANARFIKN